MFGRNEHPRRERPQWETPTGGNAHRECRHPLLCKARPHSTMSRAVSFAKSGLRWSVRGAQSSSSSRALNKGRRPERLCLASAPPPAHPHPRQRTHFYPIGDSTRANFPSLNRFDPWNHGDLYGALAQYCGGPPRPCTILPVGNVRCGRIND